MELFIFGMLGLLLGIFAGALPGLGTGSIIGIVFVALLQASPESIILFYLGILISAQYFGSVTAILTGVPGDPSSIPSATYGFKLAKKGFGPLLIFATAKYSLWTSLISFLLLVVVLHLGWYWASSLSTVFQTSIFLFAIALLIVLSRENKIYFNVILSIVGMLLGAIGYSVNYQTYFLVSSDSIFSLGIPWIPVMIGLMVIPTLVKPMQIDLTQLADNKKQLPAGKFTQVAARGGVIGFILGTVPGLSYILSSIVAAKVEENKSNDHVKIVVASESANNAGAVSMLMPLFLLGIPITASEVVVFSLLTSNTSMASIPEIIINNWITIAIYFTLINLILFVLSWKFAVPICQILFSNTRILTLVAVTVAIAGTLWLGWYNQQIFSYVIVLVISIAVGLILKFDWSVAVFSMILYPHIENNIYKLLQLYF